MSPITKGTRTGSLGGSKREALRAHVAIHLPMVRSVLVSVDNELLYEQGFNGGDLDEQVTAWSCTKSVLSMIVGKLIKSGSFPDLDERVIDLLPTVARHAHPSFAPATIRHCMDMTLGYYTDIGDHDVFSVISREVDFEPGSRFFYNDIGPHIISMLVTQITGMSTAKFASQRLFAPIGISKPPWQTDHEGFSIGGWGLFLTPKQMLRFGELALARGSVGGADLVDAAFFAESIKPQSEGGFPGNDAYGHLWWVSERKGVLSHYALGYGGQLICVCPTRELVAVVTCTDELGAEVGPAQEIFFDHILDWV